MPVRTGNTISTSRGSYNTKKKTFVGKGPPPAGSTKGSKTPTVIRTSQNGQTVSLVSSASPQQAVRKSIRATRRAQRAQTRSKQVLLASLTQEAPRSVKPLSKPLAFHGKPTVGTPTLKSLRAAQSAGTLKTNEQGYLSTPQVRSVKAKLQTVKQIKAHAAQKVKNLSAAERAAVPLVKKAHRKYPDVPAPVLMAQIKQESGFNPAAVSSADAQGLSQFIPSTAASYGVKYGTGKREQQSQVTGQAHYLHDLGFAKDPQGALSSYSGGYAASDYNNPVLAGAAAYKGVGKPALKPGQKRFVRKTTKQAARLGLKPQPQATGPAPKKVVTRFKAAKHAMREVEGLPYIWGGGHGDPTSSPTGGGLDCSGAVGYVLNKIGALKGSLTSGEMGSVLKPGPGALTVFYNPTHTFLRIGNEYWGTSVGDSGSGGLGPHPTPSASYLASYNVGHVPGLGRKQALQLGFKNLGSAQSFPGMTLSDSGTSATIDPGSGTTKSGKPGFSSSPIQLTPTQKAQKKLAKLDRLTGTSESKVTSESKAGSELSRLEAKYGKAVA